MNRQLRALALLLALFLLVNLATLSRYPSVWVDEVQFADPAVSLASGDGFTSTAWFAQDSTKFWAGNVPLYTLLLGGWLKVFGVGMVAERSLNLVLFALFAVLVWRWMRSSGTVRHPAWRLAAVALLMTGHAMVFSYRSGRYDVTGMVLAACVLALWERPLWLLLPGLLMPFAGLQLIPAALVLCVLAVFAGGRPALLRAGVLLGGTGAGLVLLRVFYSTFGVWNDFRASTAAIGLIGQSLLAKAAALPGVFFLDKSRIAVATAFVLLIWVGRHSLGARSRRICGFTLAALVLLPAALHLAGKFPIYYGWMVFVPLVIATARAAERTRVARRPAAAFLVLAALAGLPLRLACAVTAAEDRAPERVAEFVRRTVPAGVPVLADFKAYYALRASGVRPILPTYIPALRREEKASLEVLLIRADEAKAIQTQLGGEWRATGEVLAPAASPALLRRLVAEMREENYTLAVYRRVIRPAA